MTKGEVKYTPKQFIQKENVNYHNRNLQLGMCYDQYSKEGELYYYKNVFLPITDTVSVYIQEYAYNHVAHIIDYRDTDGVKWQKQYTPDGFEIYYKDSTQKCGYKFNYKEDRLTYIRENGIKILIHTKELSDIFVIRGVDFSDRFINENKELLRYYVKDLSGEELVAKLTAFKLLNIQPLVLSIIDERRDISIC